MLGRVRLALVVFLAEIKKQDAKKRMSLAWCKSMKWLKKHFLLEKEPVLRKKRKWGEVERRRGAR